MLLVIGAIIVSISVLITLVGTFVSASLSNFTINISPGNTTDDNQNGTNTTETKPSESLTLGGLSPQGQDNLATACSVLPERC
jgi:hypothetical protein